jgi:N-glycosylase/DNA lyase
MASQQSISVDLFDLDQTLASGQVFRYRRVGDRYFVCRRDRLFWLRQRVGRLEFGGAGEACVRRFLGLDHDLPATLRRLRKIPRLRPAISACRGLRIVKHDPWECLVSFICSTRSNIPKIARSLEMMARLFGRPLQCEELSDFSFPDHGSLGDLDMLKSTGVGYRAEYLAATDRLCTPAMLRRIGRMKYPAAREELKKLPGVGDKVADCVCLFSMNFGEAFPVDVWVLRAMRELFPDAASNEKEIRRTAAEMFGPDAGYAQQYLFHYQRMRAGKAAPSL